MTQAEIEEELGWIRTAKQAIYTTGQSYSRSGLQLTRASLPSLVERENQLRSQLASLNGANGFYTDFRT